MIECLAGKILYKDGSHVVIDVRGVGYGVDATNSAANALTLDSVVFMWIFTDVRDDDIKLFGFSSLEERVLFTHLISAPGVGPKLAMAMLSHLGAHAIVACVLADDAERLKQVPGIAAKAKEIQLHLKRRLNKLENEAWLAKLLTTSSQEIGLKFDQATASAHLRNVISPQIQGDLTSALINLGYKDREIQAAIKAITAEPGEGTFSALLRKAIAVLSRLDARNSSAATFELEGRSREIDQVF